MRSAFSGADPRRVRAALLLAHLEQVAKRQDRFRSKQWQTDLKVNSYEQNDLFGETMTLSSSGGYKERYLRALEDQEYMEKQFDAQLGYLRKTVTHLSSAAQGLDKNLDVELISLREKLRGAKGGQVVEQMERVHRAVAEFEESRGAENASAARAMSEVLEQYLSLKLPAELKEKLEKFSGNLKHSLNSYRIYPSILAEVAKLQQLALEAAAEPPKTFWERLKPGRQVFTAEEDVQDKPARSSAPSKPDEFQPIEDEQVTRFESEELNGEDSANLSQPCSLTDDEDSYEKVALRIAETLQGLVEKIQANDVIQHKVDIVKSRIERGMDWFALAVTLEDIRDILMLRYLDVDREFSQYLKQVNEELLSISEVLGVAAEREREQSDASSKLSGCVSDQMQRLQSSMETSESLDQLKLEVQDHLEKIQGSLQLYQQAGQKYANEGSLTQQLASLVERVHSIERESKTTKELLEAERHKATHDPLTNLPNREAYNERIFHELQRFKRYGHPLSLAVCDVDFFKRINDNYGHQAGDKVLKLLARILFTRLRKVDLVARYGGEEFVIIMPETSAPAALTVLDKIRVTIGKSALRFKGEPINITISFGITSFTPEDSVETVFARADEALYKAKNQGRNQCVLTLPERHADED